MSLYLVSLQTEKLIHLLEKQRAPVSVSCYSHVSAVLTTCRLEPARAGRSYAFCVQRVTVRSAEDERKDRSCVCQRHWITLSPCSPTVVRGSCLVRSPEEIV